jgi:ABC-type bacteriocin/lantibiotic exporter with double-glycine peptidase domain
MLWKFVFEIFYDFFLKNPSYFLINIFFFVITIISDYYLPKYYGFLLEVFNKNMNLFLNSFLNILIIKGIVYFITEFQNYYVSIQRTDVEEFLHQQLIDKIKNKFIKNPNDIVIGEKVAAIAEFQSTLSDWYSYLFDYLFSYLGTIAFFLGYVSTYDYMMPLLIIVFISSSWYLLFSNSTNCKSISEKLSDSYLKKYQDLEDYLSNILTIHTYNQFKQENNRLNSLSDDYQSKYNQNNKCTLKWSLLSTLLSGIFLLTIMYRCFILLKNGKISKSAFLSIYFIGSNILQSLTFFSDTLHEMKRDYKILTTIEKETKLDLYNKKDLQKVDETISVLVPTIDTTSLIKLININYKYEGSNEYIINNFNLEVKEGEKIALIGDIGSGKSTLIKIILGLLKPSNGDLYLNGKNYKKMDQRDIFKRFGYMTQNPVLFNRSILDNIKFGNPDVSREDIIKLLDKFQLNEVFNKLEKGIDSFVGKNGSKISGGQRQIIWFLRIYLQNPDILLMDEPTASLSPESKETLWNLIKQGFGNKTIIMSSHDEFLIKLATRKVKMNQQSNNNFDLDINNKNIDYGYNIKSKILF